MIPIRLTLNNFMSYGEHETLDFSGFDLAVITGVNGAGKSSIMEAISWAVWDKSRASSGDELIRQSTRSMWVEFIFEMEGSVYRILRKRDRRKKTGVTTLEFQISQRFTDDHNLTQWKQLTEGTIRATQEKIVQALKLPYEIFVNSAYLRQGHADEFTIKTALERKMILADILGLSMYDELEKLAREKKRQTEGQSTIYALQIEDLKHQLEQSSNIPTLLNGLDKSQKQKLLTIKNLEQDLQKLEKSQKEFELINQKITLERQRFEQIQAKLSKLLEDKKSLTNEIEQSEKVIANKNAIEKEYSEYQKYQRELDIIQQKLQLSFTIKERLARAYQTKKHLDQSVQRLKTLGKCPTCFRVLSRPEADRLTVQLRKQFNNDEQKGIEKLEKELKDIGYSEDHHQKVKLRLERLKSIEKTVHELAIIDESLTLKKQHLQRINYEIGDYGLERRSIADQGQKMKSRLDDLKGVSERYSDLDHKLRVVRQEYAMQEQQFGGLREKMNQRETWQKLLAEKEKAIKQNLEEQTNWQELADAFSKKGIQAMIIEQTIPQIEEEANRLLQTITDGRLQVRFETQREKKTGNEIIETLDIIITDELGSRNYELFSGGEAFRINFAIRIALSKLLSLRAGAKLRFLIIDEGFGALDTAGRDDIVATINGIRNDFAKVLIVTHIPEVKDIFQTKIEVKKDESGSHIALIE